jgi:hypothetical protein
LEFCELLLLEEDNVEDSLCSSEDAFVSFVSNSASEDDAEEEVLADDCDCECVFALALLDRKDFMAEWIDSLMLRILVLE